MKQNDLIESLTSIPSRVERLWIVIESMMRQRIRPRSVNLYLSLEQFPKGEQDLPHSLLKYKEKGLRIEFVEEDLRSHKKYYYALKESPTFYIVTIDDDILYHFSLLASLYQRAKNTNSIVCNWGRKPLYEGEDLLSYNDWPLLKKRMDCCKHGVFLLSDGGTIFAPNSLYKDVLNEILFTTLTPLADDIWLNTMARLNGTAFSYLSSRYLLLPIKSKNTEELWSKI